MNLGTLGAGAGLVASALLIAACGGSTGGRAPAGPPGAGATSASTTTAAATSNAPANTSTDVCSLVTQDEASTVLGIAAGAPDNTVGCSYMGPAGQTLEVIVLPVPGSSSAAFDAAKSQSQSTPGFQDIRGAGDDAFMAGGTGGGLFECLKGSKFMDITLSLGSDAAINSAALATAGTTACGRL
jgi:Protein of unknown function (DUF3558)